MSERPNTGELIAGVGGFILIIAMFLFAWFGIGPFDGDAFDAMKDWSNLILVFTAFSGMALAMFGRDVLRVSTPLSAITAGAGALSALVILLNIIIPPSDLDPKFGVFVGLICALAIAYGGYRAMQEEGASFGGANDSFGGGSSGGGDPSRGGRTQQPPAHQPPPQQPPAAPYGNEPQAPPPPPPPAS